MQNPSRSCLNVYCSQVLAADPHGGSPSRSCQGNRRDRRHRLIRHTSLRGGLSRYEVYLPGKVHCRPTTSLKNMQDGVQAVDNVERLTSIFRVTSQTERLNPVPAESAMRSRPALETRLGLNHDFALDFFNHPAHQARTGHLFTC